MGFSGLTDGKTMALYNLVEAHNGQEKRIMTNISETDANELLNANPDKALMAYIPGTESTTWGLQYIANAAYFEHKA